MRRSFALAVPALLVFALAPCAPADTFTYTISSDPGSNHSPLTGSITFSGNIGDTVPELDSLDVLGFSFHDSGIPFESDISSINSNATIQLLEDDLTFDGALGATTLSGTSGAWMIAEPRETNTSLNLWGYKHTANFFDKWDDCVVNNLDACHTIGNEVGGSGPYSGGFWTLTLSSYVASTPEPSTLLTSLGGFGIFGIGWATKRRRAAAAR